MRLIPTSFTVVALSATFMVVPTVTSGATPRPVSPVVHDVAIPAVAGVGVGARETLHHGVRHRCRRGRPPRRR